MVDGPSTTQIVLITLLFASYLAWLLVPLMPAILIRRALPDDEMNLSGPLNGLTVSASGGIATYLVLVVSGYYALAQTVWPAINRLDDGSWTFEIPFLAQGSGGEPLLIENGTRVTAEAAEANPRLIRGGIIGYSARLRATRVGDRLPMIRLVVHFPSGEARSEEIDLEEELARAKPQARRVVLPLKPVRVQS